jgi:hypothetical protein
MENQLLNLPTKSFQKKIGIVIISTIITFSIISFFSNTALIINYFLPLISIALIICMYSLNGIHHKKLYRPSNYLFPLYISLSISFGVISLIFGLHSQIFSSYIIIGNEKSDHYTWMKIDKILHFPLSQINSNNSSSFNTKVDFKQLIYDDTICHIIVIDKTKSVKNSNNEINKFLKDNIRSVFYVDPEKIHFANTSDLIPPFIFSGMYSQYAIGKDSSCEKVSVWYYTGEKELLPLGFNNTHSYKVDICNEIKNENSNFINNYFEKMLIYDESYTSRPTSELNDIITSLNNIIHNHFKGCKIKVSVVSDFLNSSNVSGNLDFHHAGLISRLNLYCLDGVENLNPTCQPFEVISNSTKNFSLLNPKTVVDLKSKKDLSIFFTDLSLSNCQYFDNKYEKELEFYYPYRGFNTNEKANSYVIFHLPDLKKHEFEYFHFKIIDDNDPKDKFPFFAKTSTMPGQQIFYSGEIDSIKIYNDDTLGLSFPFTTDLLDNSRLYLEISSLNSNKTESYSIAFKPRMPDSISHYLIFCFAFFVFSISLIMILPNIFVLNLMVKNRVQPDTTLNLFALTMPISIGLFWIYFFSAKLLSERYPFIPIIIILFILILFSLPRFFQTFRKFIVKKDSEGDLKIYSFNIFGTLIKDLKVFFTSK